MKSRIEYITIILISIIVSIQAQAPRSPKDLGAGWAKLSDRAQVELLVNNLQRKTPGSLAAAQFTAPAAAPEIYLAGDQARVAYKDGTELTLRKTGGNWKLETKKGLAARRDEDTGEGEVIAPGSFSAGATFRSVAVSPAHRVERLTRSVTRETLDRSLFGAPEKSASYYRAVYSEEAPFVQATYIQLVADPAWQRILYGSMDRWIKSYDDVRGPAGIAVDADGRVFVSEAGRQRVLVLQLHPDEENTALQLLFEIPGIDQPGELALNDNGTPLDSSDDLLYVIDAAGDRLLKYTLDAGSASRVGAYEDFSFLQNVQCGKWNGGSTAGIYTIDQVGRRIRYWEDNGNALTLREEIRGEPGQYFSALKVDHFGNVYVVDNANSRLFKYSADLELLDSDRSEPGFAGLAGIDIPFGKITIAGEGSYWAGFDQVLGLERWSERSGVQRRALGIAIRDGEFRAGKDMQHVTSRFLLTDPGEVSVHIYDAQNRLVRELRPGWMGSGRQQVTWQRRNQQGAQVPPGSYHYQLKAASPYQSADPVTLDASFYLPLYYWQNCGGSDARDDAFRVQGTPRRSGDEPSQSAATDPSQVIYRFPGLNPEREYELELEIVSPDGTAGRQRVMAGENFELAVLAGEAPARSGYRKLPAESYRDGQLTVRVIAETRGGAAVSQIWLKETGAGFAVQVDEGTPAAPESFGLEQNYPNPFNPSTHIRFQLAMDARVTLEVFNLLGQKVRRLASSQYPAGAHTVVWDGLSDAGTPAASGIYFYRLSAGEFVQSRRMLLLR